MKNKALTILKVCIFFLILALLLVGAGELLRPVWLSEDAESGAVGTPMTLEEVGDVSAYESTNEDTLKGFYTEPENHLQVLFVGASMTSVGVTPMELYENYGIPAYSVATEAQPILTSYYWVREAARLHPDSMKTVICDVSMLRREVGDGFYEKALNGMKLSENKLRAGWEAYNGPKAAIFAFPILGYHDRWDEFRRADIKKLNYEPREYLRGFNLRTTRYFNNVTYEDMPIVDTVLDEDIEEEKINAVVEDKADKYLGKMAEFCKENGIRLVLYKSPALANWSSKEHLAVAREAEKYDLEFLDFSLEPLFGEIGFNPGTDSEVNKKHNNYYGARKLTDWFGKYLTEKCDTSDVRGKAGYEYMDTELAKYQSKIKWLVELKETTSVGDYLTMLTGNTLDIGKDEAEARVAGDSGICESAVQGLTTMITIRGRAGRKLSESDRDKLRKSGLAALADIDDTFSYVAVIENGSVKYEKAVAEGTKESNGKSISYSGALPDGTKYYIASGSRNQGDLSSCTINSKEYSLNDEGINITVYDSDKSIVIDNICFDTYDSPSRETYDVEGALAKELESGVALKDMSESTKKLYLYNKRCEYSHDAKLLKTETGKTDLGKYIDHYKAMDGKLIFISTKGNASEFLSDEISKSIKSSGLSKLNALKDGEGYAAVIAGGEVTEEVTEEVAKAGKAAEELEDGAKSEDSTNSEDGTKAGDGTEPEEGTKAGDSAATENDGVDSEAVINTPAYILSSRAGTKPKSDIFINQKNYSPNKVGINVVVYDEELQMVVDTAWFGVEK